jgi:GntR family transcriptional regulator
MIERKSPIPLYYQLKQLLVDRIASGEWQPGDMVPTEEQLQEQYNLSRTTVRQALKELEFEGLISRHRGRGTFVSQPKLSHSPDPHFNLTSFLKQQGMEPGWHVLSTEWVPAASEVAERLAIDSGTIVYQLRRLGVGKEEFTPYWRTKRTLCQSNHRSRSCV